MDSPHVFKPYISVFHSIDEWKIVYGLPHVGIVCSVIHPDEYPHHLSTCVCGTIDPMAKNTVLIAKTGKTTYLPLTDKEEDIALLLRKVKAPQLKEGSTKSFDAKAGSLVGEEWFGIDLIGDDLQIIAPYVDAACTKIDPERIASVDMSAIKALAIVETTGLPRETTIHVIKTSSTQRYDRKTLIEFGVHGVTIEERTHGVEVGGVLHAYVHHGKLYFQNFNTASSLFFGIDKFFREATDEEVNEFCGLPLFLLGEEFDANLIGKRQRKQIALSLPLMPDLQNDHIRKQLTEYAKDYLPLQEGERIIQGEHFALNSPSDLAYIFHILYGDYFTNVITGEKMIAKRSEKLVGK